MARILIVGKGGYGDIFPVLALAARLRTAGHSVTLAGEAHHADAARDLALPLHPLPTADADGRPGWLGELLATMAPATLETEYEALLDLAADADLIVGNQLAYGGALVRRKLGKPWVYCAASPLAVLSELDPPTFPYLAGLQRLARAGGLPTGGFVRAARLASQLLMQRQRALQRRLGLPDGGHPRFEGMYSEDLNLLMVSPRLVEAQADWPRHTVASGFAWYEPGFLRAPEKAAAIARFLADGPPPVIFAPGGSLRSRPGRFFSESIAACRRSGRRGILVAAQRHHAALPKSPDILVTPYIPYADILPGAAAIVHSCGIGALGWALRFGVPSLVVPALWDQHDNAERARQRGLVRVLPARRFGADNLARELDTLLADDALRARTVDYGRTIAAEDGAGEAARRIEALLARLGIK